MFLFLLFAGFLTIRANRSDPIRLEEGLFLLGFVIFLAYTLYWVVGLVRAFRVPAAPPGGSAQV